jgi:hypothetical protein
VSRGQRNESPRPLKRNTQTLIDASKEVGLGVNTEDTKHIFLSHYQNAGQDQDTKIGNIF